MQALPKVSVSIVSDREYYARSFPLAFQSHTENKGICEKCLGTSDFRFVECYVCVIVKRN